MSEIRFPSHAGPKYVAGRGKRNLHLIEWQSPTLTATLCGKHIDVDSLEPLDDRAVCEACELVRDHRLLRKPKP